MDNRWTKGRAAAAVLLAFSVLVLLNVWMALPAKAQRTAVIATCGTLTQATPAIGSAGIIGLDQSGNVCVSASVTASVTGFAPAGTFATLTATGSSASVALPAGAVVVFSNTGTTAVSCTLGIGSATAVASNNVIQSGSWMAMTVGSNTFGACIDQTGSASNVVVLSGGSGLPTGAGGGGSGGGGGAVTIADAADASQGGVADAACATDNGSCTVVSLLKRENQRLTTVNTTLGTPLQAGGTVSITAIARAARNFPGATVGVASAQALAASTATVFLQIQNTHASNTVACAFGVAAVLNSSTSVQLAAGQSASWGPNTGGVPTGALNCIASQASTPLYVEWL